MINVLEVKDKYGKEVYDHSYSNTEGTFSKHEKERYSLRLPLIKANMIYSYAYDETPDFANREQDIDITKKFTLKIGKEEISFSDHSGATRVQNFSALVEAVVAYDYASKHINEAILDGVDSKQLKSMSVESLGGIVERRRNTLTELKDIMEKIAMGKNVEKTGKDVIDEVFGKDKVDLDKIVEENLSKEIRSRERATENQNRIDAIKGGFAKVGRALTLIPREISKKIKERGELKKLKAQERAVEKENNAKKREYLDELSM